MIDSKIIEELKIFFNADIIGSTLLYENKLIPIDLVEDVDVLIDYERFDNVCLFLKSKGYNKSETDRYPGWKYVIKDINFRKQGYKKIHVMQKPKSVVIEKQTDLDIIFFKARRRNLKDCIHLSIIFKNMAENKEKLNKKNNKEE